MTAELLWRCTAQLGSGAFCDARGMVDMPFPICARHARQIYERMREHEASRLESAVDRARAKVVTPEVLAARAETRRRYEEQAVVYYMKIGPHIKIGTTKNLRERIKALRCDPIDLLATEPGGREVEAERHRQFADDRLGRREDFKPSRRLLAHIRDVLAAHGTPTVTGFLAPTPPVN
jgi:hypothetical protein